MPIYIIRVELHGSERKDYEKLHTSMELEGYLTYITLDSGEKYKLPDAEYVFSTEKYIDIQKIAESTKKIADAINDNSGILVTKVEKLGQKGLQAVTD